jgi:DNA-binding CsgD family transcriptional regulator
VSDVALVARPGTPLTDGERKALRAIWDHGTEAAAAVALDIPRGTLHAQLANARSRLRVHTTLQAVRKGLNFD